MVSGLTLEKLDLHVVIIIIIIIIIIIVIVKIIIIIITLFSSESDLLLENQTSHDLLTLFRAAILVYCSVRDWTRFCYVIGFESIQIHLPHVIGFVPDLFFPLWRADSKIFGFAADFAGCVLTEAVSGKKKLHIQK